MGLTYAKSAEHYRRQLTSLLPTGFIWPVDGESSLAKVLLGWSAELARVDQRVVDMLDEVDPRSTYECIEDWERGLGIPDECETLGSTIQERREAIIARLVVEGNQTLAWYEALAAALGFNVKITENFPFRTGLSSMGDPLNGGEWLHTWVLHVDPNNYHAFTLGVSGMGEPLRTYDDAALFCALDRLKPAHTTYTVEADLETTRVFVIGLLDDPPLIDYIARNGAMAYHGDDVDTVPLIPKTPYLNSLAASGVMMQEFRAMPVCTPTRANIQTGLDGFRTGVLTVIGPDRSGELGNFGDGDFGVHPTLAHTLENEGVKTFVIGKLHFSMHEDETGDDGTHVWPGIHYDVLNRLGYSDWRVTLRNLNQYGGPTWPTPGDHYNYEWNRNGVFSAKGGVAPPPPAESYDVHRADYSTTVCFDELKDVLDNVEPGDQVFIYLALPATHGPFDLPHPDLVATPEYTADPPRAGGYQFAAMEAVDAEFGRVFDEIPEWLKPAITWAWMGDNGVDGAAYKSIQNQYGWDLGSKWDTLLNTGPQQVKQSVYEGGLRNWCFVSGSIVQNPGRVSESLVSAVDLFPTVCDYFGVPHASVDGFSMMPIIENTVIPQTHARQHHLSIYGKPNGSIAGATEFLDEGWLMRLTDYGTGSAAENGLFKLLRRSGEPDLFFQIRNGDWTLVDPFEENPLDFAGAWSDHYDDMVAALAEYEGSTTEPSEGLQVTLEDGSTGTVLLSRTGKVPIKLENLSTVDLDLGGGGGLPVTLEDGTTIEVEI